MLNRDEPLVLLGTGITVGGSSLRASLGLRWVAMRGSRRWNWLNSTVLREPPG